MPVYVNMFKKDAFEKFGLYCYINRNVLQEKKCVYDEFMKVSKK